MRRMSERGRLRPFFQCLHVRDGAALRVSHCIFDVHHQLELKLLGQIDKGQRILLIDRIVLQHRFACVVIHIRAVATDDGRGQTQFIVVRARSGVVTTCDDKHMAMLLSCANRVFDLWMDGVIVTEHSAIKIQGEHFIHSDYLWP
ncbi:hypothetical protein DN42_3257 [Vibrio cholerae]|nr:hypothetical protein DN42_3257 [Vibrio cholerae]